MKKLTIILAIIATTAMFFSSCGKYEEGPGFSLLTKKARLTGTWKLIEKSTSGNSIDLSGVTVKITIEKDGTGKMISSGSVLGVTFTNTEDLEWEFNDSKEKLRMRSKDQGSENWDDWDESEILRLTNKECWLKADETTLKFEKE